MYQKEIIYMGLFHNDIKERNAGYLKVDKKEDTYRLEIQVKNLPGMIAGSFPIRLQSQTGWQEADALVIKDGNGKWSGSAAEQILRAEVIVSDDRRIKGESRFGVTKKNEKETTAKETTAEETTGRTMRPNENEEERDAAEWKAMQTETGPKADIRTRHGSCLKELPVSDNKTESMAVTGSEAESGVAAGNRRESEPQDISPRKALTKTERTPVKRSEHIPLYENKWEQLLTTYEQIHPYGDNRIYVKLEPKDFIILRENYQHLVNNSFLLHGFYNYRYLILGKEREKEKEKGFYLGVPGVFYEREKMVALMFGFEAFECEGDEAEEGKFGYYLRKVEL